MANLITHMATTHIFCFGLFAGYMQYQLTEIEERSSSVECSALDWTVSQVRVSPEELCFVLEQDTLSRML